MRSWETYRDALRAGHLPVDDEEMVDEETAGLERAWLLLRTDAGYPLADAGEAERRLADVWTRQGWATVDGETLRLTAEGWLLLDRLAVEMASAREASDQPSTEVVLHG